MRYLLCYAFSCAFVVLLCSVPPDLYAQTRADLISAGQRAQLNNIRSAEDLVSGNYHDVLNSFFQLAVKDIAGPDKQLQFSSSLFAIRLKTAPNLNLDRNLVQQRWSRNTNINIALRLDSSFRFSGFSVGAKYALVNKRDYAVSRQFVNDVLAANEKRNRAYNRMDQLISQRAGGNAEYQEQLIEEKEKYIQDNLDYNDLSEDLKQIITQATNETFDSGIVDPAMFFKDARVAYQKIKNSYANRFLLVGGASATVFREQFLAREVSLFLEGTGDLLGKTRIRHGLELIGLANFRLSDDSSTFTRDLDRGTLHTEAALNMVFRNEVCVPLLELQVGCGYDRLLAGAFAGEDEDLLTLNGIVRIRITKDIFIPIGFRYDPEHKDVFGFLNLTTNFDLLNSLLRN